MRKLIIILLLILSVDAGAQVQELSLEKAKELLHTQSRELEIKEAEVEQALQDVRETRSVFLPKVNLSETGVNTNNPLNAFGINITTLVGSTIGSGLPFRQRSIDRF